MNIYGGIFEGMGIYCDGIYSYGRVVEGSEGMVMAYIVIAYIVVAYILMASSLKGMKV